MSFPREQHNYPRRFIATERVVRNVPLFAIGAHRKRTEQDRGVLRRSLESTASH